MRAPFVLFAALAVAACTPAVPDSAAGVGFEDYNAYNNPPPVAAPTPPAGFSPDNAAAAIDRATGVAPAAPAPAAPLSALQAPAAPVAAPVATGDRPRGNAPAGIKEENGEMQYVKSGVSDEQDFEAVKARETIESDKARIERNKAQYQVDQPTALPQRAGDTGPNIVQFALSTSHPVGTQMYSRSAIRLTNPDAACLKYASPDLAQEAFLTAGGPERDRKGIDPDGDGYACGWNPAPFRAALQ